MRDVVDGGRPNLSVAMSLALVSRGANAVEEDEGTFTNGFTST
jgi:hypothetical protein